MIILKAISTPQSITAYVREHTSTGNYTASIFDEEKNKLTTQAVTGTYDEHAVTFDVTFNFQAQRFYTIKLKNGDDVINFSKIYTTDQTDFDKYTVLADYYSMPPEIEQEFIVKP